MKLLFKVYPQKSHYNATFAFAKKLQEEGHEVIYAGLHQLKKHVEAQGFRFYEEERDFFPYCDPSQVLLPKGFKDKLRQYIFLIRHKKEAYEQWKECDLFSELIQHIQPDRIYVDSPYSCFALSLYASDVEFAMLESMMPQDRARGCPPLDTAYIPKDTWVSDRICDLLWFRHRLKRWFLGVIGIRPDYSKRLVYKIAKKYGVERSVIDFDRYFHLGLRNIPEYILSPRKLDFPRTLKPNQHYIESSVNLEREESVNDYLFESRFAKYAEEREQGTPLIYCSLGTGGWRYDGGVAFLNTVISACEKLPVNLILSLGGMDRSEIRGIPANVSVFDSVPQLRVLKESDLMITHGGMNSIKECMALSVKMLVYPGCYLIDQGGNAARAAYHQYGRIGLLSKESISGIMSSIRASL
jgi:UDP:flavonoid glycosyltransferase YjiC (YdhE family)